jgi:hypothetical protein
MQGYKELFLRSLPSGLPRFGGVSVIAQLRLDNVMAEDSAASCFQISKNERQCIIWREAKIRFGILKIYGWRAVESGRALEARRAWS